MRKLFTYSLLLVTVFSFAQQAKKQQDKYLKKGNSEFTSKNYAEAEANYRISQSKSPARAAAAYNLANSIYRQNKNVEAAYGYSDALKNATTKQQKHMAYHNLGNVFMKEKEYQNAVDAYKNALRNDPTDEESRYNLAVAKEMLKNNPPPPQPKDDKDKDKKDQKDNKDQQPNNGGNKDDKNQPPKDKGDNKDKGGKGDDKDKGDKGDQKDKGDKGDQKDKGDNGDKQDQGQNGGKPKPEAGQSPSKQRMENLLDAMNNEEKKIQDKIQGRKVKVKSTQQEKDW